MQDFKKRPTSHKDHGGCTKTIFILMGVQLVMRVSLWRELIPCKISRGENVFLPVFSHINAL